MRCPMIKYFRYGCCFLENWATWSTHSRFLSPPGSTDQATNCPELQPWGCARWEDCSQLFYYSCFQINVGLNSIGRMTWSSCLDSSMSNWLKEMSMLLETSLCTYFLTDTWKRGHKPIPLSFQLFLAPEGALSISGDEYNTQPSCPLEELY